MANRVYLVGGNVQATNLIITSGAETIIILPTADPHVVGALWNDAGSVTVSAG